MLQDNEKLSKRECAKLYEIIHFAIKRKVKMIFESNGILVGDTALDFLRKFPEVDYNLDLGHLNLGLNRGMLGLEVEDFIKKIKDRVVYVHAHNNNGQKDEHRALSDGTLDWQKILDLLDLKKVNKIMSETRTLDGDLRNIEAVRNYLKAKGYV